MTKIFVYGTLLRGEVNSGFLSGLTVTPAKAIGRIYRMPAGYPAMAITSTHISPNNQGTEWVSGELVELKDDKRLTFLDNLEGVNRGLYTRKKIKVSVASRTYEAWAWVMPTEQIKRSKGRLIKGGQWRKISPMRSC